MIFDVSLYFFFTGIQYFKMDAENYDSYGGVDHVSYCFQVLSPVFQAKEIVFKPLIISLDEFY